MANLDTALELAFVAHRNQKDRYGKPYILHPLRVMAKVRGESQQIVAALHDVIEDSTLTLSHLRAAGFSQDIIDAVDALSRRPDEPYFDYIDRLKSDPLAVAVKLADLEDNMDLTRLSAIETTDAERLNKYLRAWHILKSLTDQGETS